MFKIMRTSQFPGFSRWLCGFDAGGRKWIVVVVPAQGKPL
jgi:hypothetical protein